VCARSGLLLFLWRERERERERLKSLRTHGDDDNLCIFSSFGEAFQGPLRLGIESPFEHLVKVREKPWRQQ
jgi:hypothetical protein